MLCTGHSGGIGQGGMGRGGGGGEGIGHVGIGIRVRCLFAGAFSKRRAWPAGITDGSRSSTSGFVFSAVLV